MRWLVHALIGLVLATPIPAPHHLTVSKLQIEPGESVTVSGTGFTCPGIFLTLGAEPLAEEFAPTGGRFDKDVTVPTDMPPGDHDLEASCSDNSYSDKVVVVVSKPRATPQPRILLTPRSARPGDTVTVDGTGFDACIERAGSTINALTPVPVQVTLDADPAVLAEENVSESGTVRGTFHTTFTVPPGVTAAGHRVTATCTNRSPTGRTTASETLTVVGVPGPSPTSPPPHPDPGGTGTHDGQQPGGDPGGSAPEIPRTPTPITPGDSGALGARIAGMGLVAAIGIGLVALRRRLRPAGPLLPVPKQSGRQRLPTVTARSGGVRSGPVQARQSAGHDTAIRVVARPGGGAR